MQLTVWTEESDNSSLEVLVHWRFSGQHYSKSSNHYIVDANRRINQLRNYAREHGYQFAIAL